MNPWKGKDTKYCEIHLYVLCILTIYKMYTIHPIFTYILYYSPFIICQEIIM